MRAALEDRDREIRALKNMVEKLKARVEDMTERAQGAPDLAALQTMLAGAMNRPVHMPQAGFDVQSAMINATSTTGELQRRKPQRRQRARITG